MNHERIARMYLAWFEQEAHAMSVSTRDGSSSLHWSENGEFVLSYSSPTGDRHWSAFVDGLCVSRLDDFSDWVAVQRAAADLIG